ncbi:hypothetical protein N7466_004101 [Penicillium verhagenii]|uniref:uncharacterized protein n=1 Tax=Penicillium verhagenii TaxID=1562060 RepID=UPI002545701D|nr:uncharacterized protein N7466_004101 [Penicillium verhagenii]KAJ5934554.1 hypothetical protein N7466_004101 [Penicillium verhagenii]
MPNPLQAPDHPIALRRSHLLAPAPDRLTNTPTTLRILREHPSTGREFSVVQLRTHEDPSSPRRHVLLFNVVARFWSNTQLREIRNPNGRALLELRRIWWKGRWVIRRAGGAGEDLLHSEVRWGIGMRMGVKFENALLRGVWDREEIAEMNRNLNQARHGRPAHHRSMSLGSPYSRRGEHRTARASSARRPGQDPIAGSGRSVGANANAHANLPHYEHPDHHSPPPYASVVAEDAAQQSSSGASGNGSGAGGGSGGSASESEDESSDDDDKAGLPDCPLPSYDSVRRMRALSLSNHSLQDLLDAIEPPGEPAPASTSSLSSPRPRSEGAIVSTKVELKLVQQSSSYAAVMMGEKRIVNVRREKVMDANMSGSMPRWEVEVAEGVDLLLATSLVLILAESAKSEPRMRSK